jgi:hypothetical protein
VAEALIWVMPRTFRAIVGSHACYGQDHNAPSLVFDPDEPLAVELGDERMHVLEAVDKMHCHPQLVEVLNHIIEHPQLFTSSLFD